MKKLITLSLFAVIFSVIFSACSSGTSITKRRYNKGYYVAHTKDRKTVKSENKQAGTATQPKANDQVVVVDVPKKQTEESAVTVNGFVENKKTDVTTFEEKKAGNQKSILQKEKNNGFDENPITQVQNKIREARAASNSSSDRDGLSLFWIVILVILILWLIGFSVGTLGSLINLLLLVALILLILWLLRVI